MKLLINNLAQERLAVRNTTINQLHAINMAILNLCIPLCEKKKWDLAKDLARLIGGEEMRNDILQSIENKRLQID